MAFTNKITKANVVAIAGMTVLGILSIFGQLSNSGSASICSVILLTLLELSLLSSTLIIAIKAKKARNNFGIWRKVESVSIVAYVIFALVFSSLLNIEGYKSALGGWSVFVVLHLFILSCYFFTFRSPRYEMRSPPHINRTGELCIDNDGCIVRRSPKIVNSKVQSRRQKGTTYTPFPTLSFADLSIVYSSIFTPAEVRRKNHMLVQVYLHLYEETEKVMALAQDSDKNAERRDYIPLQCKLKKGDKVDVQLNIYCEMLLMSDKKSVVWQGSFTKCSFDYFVPKDIDMDELSCVAMLTVNEVPVGEMRFITRIVDAPRQLNPEIIAHKYNKVFISYSHQDESKVKFLHEGLELGSVPHFFDRKYLKAGDVFPQVIQDYINSADLFILCWSENASKSEYVQKERLQALERAFPQVKPEQEAKLRIYPMSIEPRADLPGDMKENYHFGEI